MHPLNLKQNNTFITLTRAPPTGGLIIIIIIIIIIGLIIMNESPLQLLTLFFNITPKGFVLVGIKIVIIII